MLEKIKRLLRSNDFRPAEGYSVSLGADPVYVVFLRDDMVSALELLTLAKRIPKCQWEQTTIIMGKELVRMRRELHHPSVRPSAVLFFMEE
jgi:hypothetical protein